MSQITHNSLFLATVLVISVCLISARPPGRDEQEQKLVGGEPIESEDFVDYFEDFIPVLQNSTKLHDNYHLEKKTYLTAVLGFPEKMRKMS
ncbi:unnamed protein product [Caenorhabditis sp. 36 PRJEB53466]|nr:unnamed protein product [Caenorhabditis sp. 36 PRJEB53466]